MDGQAKVSLILELKNRINVVFNISKIQFKINSQLGKNAINIYGYFVKSAL